MKFRAFIATLLLAGISAISLQHCASGAKLPTAQTFLEAIQIQNNATTFLRLIEGAGGLANVLGKEKYTLLVPVDPAFSTLGIDALMSLLAPDNTALATEALKGHILLGTFSPEQLAKGGSLPKLNGKSLVVNVTNGIQLGEAKIVGSVKTKEGYVHFLDAVLKD